MISLRSSGFRKMVNLNGIIKLINPSSCRVLQPHKSVNTGQGSKNQFNKHRKQTAQSRLNPRNASFQINIELHLITFELVNQSVNRLIFSINNPNLQESPFCRKGQPICALLLFSANHRAESETRRDFRFHFLKICSGPGFSSRTGPIRRY